MARFLLVPSFTTDGQRYLLKRRRNGWTCECPAFDRARGGGCKHTRVAEAVEHAADRCAQLHDRREVGVCPVCVAALLVTAARKVKRHYAPKAEREERKKR